MFHKNANSSHGILVQTVYLENYVEEAEVNSSQCFSNLSRKWVIFLPSSNIRAFILLEVGTQLASKIRLSLLLDKHHFSQHEKVRVMKRTTLIL